MYLLLDRSGVVLLEMVRGWALGHAVTLIPGEMEYGGGSNSVTESWYIDLLHSAQEYKKNVSWMGSSIPDCQLSYDNPEGSSVRHKTCFSSMEVWRGEWKAEFSHTLNGSKNKFVAFDVTSTNQNLVPGLKGDRYKYDVFFQPEILEELLKEKEDAGEWSCEDDGYHITDLRSLAYAAWFNLVLRYVDRMDIHKTVAEIFGRVTGQTSPDFVDGVEKSFNTNISEVFEKLTN